VSASEPVRVFISYCHQPEAHRELALQLANRLRQDGVDARIDRYTPSPLEGWARWTSRELEHARFVLVICSRAYRERFDADAGAPSGVGWEADLIRQGLYQRGQQQRFIPVLFEGDEGAVPAELAKYTRYRYPAEYDSLFRQVTDQPEVLAPSIGSLRTLMPLPIAAPVSEGATDDVVGPRIWNVPSRPDQFLARAELDKLRSILLWGGAQTVAMAGQHAKLGIQGMPGVGKTVLAVALATDAAVQKAFPGGIFWLTIGRDPDGLVGWQEQLATAASGRVVQFDNPGHGKARLRDLFARRPPSLLILDDVWSVDHADPFNVLAAPSKLLITTRNKEVAYGLGAKIREITELSPDDALTLLAAYAERPVDDLPRVAAAIVRECGELPLALAMAGAMLRGRPDNRWDSLLEQLKRSNLEHLAATLPDYRQHRSMLAAINASVDELPEQERSCFFDVATCARYGALPESVLHLLWRDTPGWSLSITQRIIDALLDRALIQQAAREQITIHNLQHDYVRAVGGDLRPRHQRLVRAYLDGTPDRAFHAVGNDGYFFEHIAKHLLEGEGPSALRALLLDERWLEAKLRATEPNALLADFDLLELEGDRVLQMLRDALQLSVHVLGPRPAELPAQLVGRLRSLPHEELRLLCARVEAQIPSAQLLPLWPTLTPPGGALMCTLDGHQGFVQAVALSTDGTTVLSGSEDKSLKVWSLATGKALRTLEGHQGAVTSVALNADASIAISASADRTLRVWDVATGRALRVLEGHTRPVQAVALSPDGKTAVSGAGDRTLKVWDVLSGAPLRTLEGHQGSVRAVALGKDGHTVVSGSKDGTVRVWSIVTGDLVRTLEGHKGWVLSVALGQDMRTIVSVSDDGTAKVWSLPDGKEICSLVGHEGWVLSVALSADCRTAVTGSSDGTLRIWDVQTGRRLNTWSDQESWVWCVACSQDAKTVLAASNNLKSWRVTDREVRASSQRSVRIESVALSNRGDTALVASEGAVVVVDVATGSTVRILEGHRGWLRAVAFSPDGAMAVSGSEDATLRVWDIQNGRTLRVLEGHQGVIQAVAFSGDGRTIASASSDQTVRTWDATTGEQRAVLTGHKGVVQAVALSGDGRRAVSGSTETVLYVWDLVAGCLAATLTGHEGSVLSVAISQDGLTALSGSTDKTLKIWDVRTGQVRHTLEGHQRWVQAVALTADGQLAISGSIDKTVQAWDVHTGALLATFTVESPVTSLAVDASGRVLTGDSVGRMHLFALRLRR